MLVLVILQQQCSLACAAKLAPLRSLQREFGSYMISSIKPVKSADRSKSTEATLSQKRRQLQQQSSNQFNACPMADYIYSGATMDSIFDELSVDEFQSVIEYVVRHLHHPINTP